MSFDLPITPCDPAQSTPRRIAMLITRSDSVGGAQVHVLMLAKALQKAGHDIHVFAGADGPYFEHLAQAGIPAHSIPHLQREMHPLFDPLAISEIYQAMSAFSPDLISCHSTKCGWFGRLVAKRLRVPSVYTVHGWFFDDAPKPRLSQRLAILAERGSSKLTQHVITVCAYDKRIGMTHRMLDAQKTFVVYNAVPDIIPSLVAEPEQHPPKLISVIRLEDPKDPVTALQALARHQDKPWTYDIVGDGPNHAAVAAEIERLDLGRRVQLLGYRRDVAECLSRAQILLFPSRWEGFPISIVEAMRAGLPIVASRVGGVGEAVSDGMNGLLVPPSNVDALSHALGPMLADPALRTRLGKASRQRYETEFSFEPHLHRIWSVYKRAMGEVEAPPR